MSLGLINEPAFRRWLFMPTVSDRSRIIWIYMTKGAETLSEMLRFKGIERWTLSKTCQLQQYFRQKNSHHFTIDRNIMQQCSAAACIRIPHHPAEPHRNTNTHRTRAWDKSTISRKLLKMDVLTFETCWAVNSEIIKQVTSMWIRKTN